MRFLLLLVAWNGENEEVEAAGRNLDIEGDDAPFDGNSSGAACRIIVVGGLNAATKRDVPPPPLGKKDSMILLFLRLQQLQEQVARSMPRRTPQQLN